MGELLRHPAGNHVVDDLYAGQYAGDEWPGRGMEELSTRVASIPAKRRASQQASKLASQAEVPVALHICTSPPEHRHLSMLLTLVPVCKLCNLQRLSASYCCPLICVFAVADTKQRNLMAAEFYGKEYVLFEGGTLNNTEGAHTIMISNTGSGHTRHNLLIAGHSHGTACCNCSWRPAPMLPCLCSCTHADCWHASGGLQVLPRTWATSWAEWMAPSSVPSFST